uniref:Uncharacterized protein n=1 Tax=Anopheles maculatus TaxID=74869 RepID=A0A182T6V4_9DIPT
MESTNSVEGRLAESTNDSKTQSSTEQEVAIGDDRLIKAVTSPNMRRRDHRHKKKPQSTTAHRRYGALDDTFDENMNIARFVEPNDDDLSQILLFNAAAAAMATMPDNDASVSNPAQYNRKLFNDNNKN